jgi:hypothetical protein
MHFKKYIILSCQGYYSFAYVAFTLYILGTINCKDRQPCHKSVIPFHV